MSKTKKPGASRPETPGIAPDPAKSRTAPPGVAGGSLRAPRPDAGFDVERAAYASRKPGLLETAIGLFVVLVGEEMVGPCGTFRDAYLAGRRRFGPGPLYIKQVRAEGPVFEPIALEPCPS